MPTLTPRPGLLIPAAEPSGVSLAIAVELRDGRPVVDVLAGTEPWRPRILAPDGPLARVALVQSRASLLSGDVVAVRIELGRQAALELVELGATVANHVRGGAGAIVDIRVSVAAGARLVWLAQPLIVSAGCDVERTTSIDLGTGARALVGEAIVLGRHGEQPGGARSRTRITLEGRPVLDETFSTEPAWLLRSTVVAGESRMIEALTLAGVRDGDPPTGTFQAHEPATLWRSLGPAHAGPPGASELAERWRALAVD